MVDGSIEIPAGAGPRLVLLAYAQLTGQNVKRAALGAEGPVLDHYSAAAARHHLRHVGDPLLDAVPAHLLGSVFCDSLEVYGSDWTPDLLAEFRSRRGYDPLPHLYRLIVDGPDASQLRADYHRTLSELYEDNFVAVFQRLGGRARRTVPDPELRHAAGHDQQLPPCRPVRGRGLGLDRAHPDQVGVLGGTPVWARRRVIGDLDLGALTVLPSHSPRSQGGGARAPARRRQPVHRSWLAVLAPGTVPGGRPPRAPNSARGLGWFFYAAGALDDRNPWWPAMPPLVRYLTRLCWLMRQGMPVADVLVYVPGQDVFARMGTAVGGSLDAWREARQLIGDDVIRVIRQGGWDFDLVDDESLAVLPADASRAVIISGATSLPAAAQAWFEQHVSAGGIVITVDSAVDIAGATACGVADLDTVLSASCEPDVRLHPRTTDVGVVHRRTAEADIYLVINTGPSARSIGALTPFGPRLVRGVGCPGRRGHPHRPDRCGSRPAVASVPGDGDRVE